jgi:glycosyltransferase involved in cell wall biosynthesis
MPEVSVIIPVYNRNELLREALESVFHQNYYDYEIIVVDDGSDEPVSDHFLPEENFHIIRHDTNKGVSVARNSGIVASRGKYVAFLDSDDVWLPEKLLTQLTFIKENNNKVSANVTGFFLTDEFGIQHTEIPEHQDDWYKYLMLGCGLGPGTTLMVHRLAFDLVGLFDASLIRYEDWDWLLRFVDSFPLTVISEPLANVHRSSISEAKVVESSTYHLLDKHMKDFQRFGIFYARKAIAKRWLELAIYFLKDRDFIKGLSYLIKTLMTYPFHKPGMYLLLLDSFLGTSFAPWFIRLKMRLLDI